MRNGTRTRATHSPNGPANKNCSTIAGNSYSPFKTACILIWPRFIVHTFCAPQRTPFKSVSFGAPLTLAQHNRCRFHGMQVNRPIVNSGRSIQNRFIVGQVKALALYAQRIFRMKAVRNILSRNICINFDLLTNVHCGGVQQWPELHSANIFISGCAVANYFNIIPGLMVQRLWYCEASQKAIEIHLSQQPISLRFHKKPIHLQSYSYDRLIYSHLHGDSCLNACAFSHADCRVRKCGTGWGEVSLCLIKALNLRVCA